MIKTKLRMRWIAFKENGLFPWVSLYFDILSIRDCSFDEMLYGTSVKFEGSRKWYSPMRWLFGRRFYKRIDPRKIAIKKFESREPKYGKSPVFDALSDIKKYMDK